MRTGVGPEQLLILPISITGHGVAIITLLNNDNVKVERRLLIINRIPSLQWKT